MLKAIKRVKADKRDMNVRTTMEQFRQKTNYEIDMIFNFLENATKYINKKSYKKVINTAVPGGGEIEVPTYYEVGTFTLDVFLNGEKLIPTTENDPTGINGHYYEKGLLGRKSNKIVITTDWTTDVGDVFEFIIKEVQG